MREFCAENAPEKLPLFEMVYVSRFRRLWESWARANEPHPWWEEWNNEMQ
jgi:hypothetical protein